MATILAAYAASSSVTITLASLASSSSLLVGRASTAVDNTTNLYLDYLIAGNVTTGTSPTAGTIEVWAVGIENDSTWPDSLAGSDAAKTFVAEVKAGLCKLVASIATNATSATAYYFGPVSAASLFGGTLPKKFALFVTQSTAVALSSTAGNHVISITPAYATSA